MKGICFIEPLFNATIEGRKTQTRRIVRPQPSDSQLWNAKSGFQKKSKYCKGEILYLKEPYIDDLRMDKIYYKYSDEDVKEISELLNISTKKARNAKKLWKNKLFMPDSSARYFIKITDIRIERLQEISEEDCMKEGIENVYNPSCQNRYGLREWYWAEMELLSIDAYATLIDKINGLGTWESNPFVFVYDYELV